MCIANSVVRAIVLGRISAGCAFSANEGGSVGRSSKRHTGAIGRTHHAGSVDLKYVFAATRIVRIRRPLSGRIMRKLGQILLAGTTLSAIVSVARIEIVKAEPLRLAAAVCPKGQVGTPPNCKPAPPPPPQHPNPPPQHPNPPPVHPNPPPPVHTNPPPQVHTNPTPPVHTN